MKKYKIQIAVISIITVITFGGIFFNNKYAHVATSQQNETQIANKEIIKKITNPKKLVREKKESLHSEKKNGGHGESSRETDAERKIADKNAATSTVIESTNDSQEEVSSAMPNNNETKNPVVEPKEEPVVPPTMPSQPEPIPEPQKEVFLSIKGTVSNSSSYFISPQKIGLKEGQSVMDVLSEYCRNNGIQVGIRGGTYVAGINNLYEFDKGAESGWLYRVNGEFPSYGAAQYAVQVGATIEWMYTENMGKDVGAPQV